MCQATWCVCSIHTVINSHNGWVCGCRCDTTCFILDCWRLFLGMKTQHRGRSAVFDCCDRALRHCRDAIVHPYECTLLVGAGPLHLLPNNQVCDDKHAVIFSPDGTHVDEATNIFLRTKQSSTSRSGASHVRALIDSMRSIHDLQRLWSDVVFVVLGMKTPHTFPTTTGCRPGVGRKGTSVGDFAEHKRVGRVLRHTI